MLAWLRGQVSPVFGAMADLADIRAIYQTRTFSGSQLPPKPSAPPGKPVGMSRSMSSAVSTKTTTKEQEATSSVVVREMPAKFEDAVTSDVANIIAYMLNQIMTYNDRFPLNPDHLTRFHSRAPPAISIQDYLARIVRYTSLETACLLCILVYIDRACKRQPTFMMNSLTVHRFVIAAVTASAKAFCDTYCTNAHYAKVGGVSCAELNALELELLCMLDWQLFCKAEVLQDYYENIVRQHPAYRLASETKLSTPAVDSHTENTKST